MMGNALLGQLGTFDVENYGDLLYPILFEKMLKLRRKNTKTSLFSIRGSNFLQHSGYRTRPVSRLFSSFQESPHALVVGGGDLLHIQWDTVVSYYKSLCQQEGEDLRPSFLRRQVMSLSKQPMNPDDEFRRRYLKYPAVGPFMIKPNGKKIRSVTYCSCGVPSPFEDSIKPQIADTFNAASFIYVRDHLSKKNLVEADVKKEIYVAPDLIVALSDFFDAAIEREKGRRILREHGVDTERNILIFQCNRQLPEYIGTIVAQLKSAQARIGCEVVLVPLGGCHGDREYLQEIASRSQGAFTYLALRSIFDIISVLAGCDIFLGTSMHGNITAFSFGIPHAFGRMELKKREGFLDIVHLPENLKIDSWAESNTVLDRAIALKRDFFKQRAEDAKQRVHEVFDKLCHSLNTQESAPV